MRIVFFSSRFANGQGGVEKVLELLVERVKAEKIVISTIDNKVSLLQLLKSAFQLEFSQHPTYLRYKVWMGMPKSLKGFLVFPFRFIFSNLAIYKIFKIVRADVVNYHFPDDSMWYFWISNRIFHFKYVLNIHGNDLQLFSKKLQYRWMFSSILGGASKIIVNSKYMHRELIRSYPQIESKVQIIPNGIDLKYISGVASMGKANRPYIFYVGRLVHKKGVDILLQAFSRLGKDDVDLIIEGSGEEIEKLKKYCIDNKIHNVSFTNGNLSQDEKFSMIKNAVFGVVPSRIEPFGIVALEYMACGTPVIVSDTGGLSDIVTDNYNGIKFINENVEDLKDKMIQMFEDESLRRKVSVNSLDYVKQYDLPNIVGQYEKVFSEVKK